MRKMFVFLLLFLLIGNLTAQTKRPLTVEDLWAMKRIGRFDVSADGKLVVFELTKFNLDKNKDNTDIYLINSNGTSLRALKNSGKSETEPHFSSEGKFVYYLIDRQLWKCDLNGENDKKITDFYSGVSGYELNKDNTQILFVSNVYPECIGQKCNEQKDESKKKIKYSGKIFTELMYRHWNRWRGEKRSHLFLFDVEKNKYFDLTKNSTSDVPPIDLGSSNDYSFSPDGKEVAFTLNPSKNLAISTNNEVYTLNISSLTNKSSVDWKKISVSKGNDNQPVYSPDGKFIAFRSMKRAGFEADKSDLVIYDRKTGELKSLTSDWSLSVGEIIWSKDSKGIFITTPYEVFNVILRIDISSGKRTKLVTRNINSSIQLSSDGQNLFFKKQKSTKPYELFDYNLNNNKILQITHVNQKRLKNVEMNEIETFWTKGANNTPVQSILVKPPFFDPQKKYPMIFLIHGGPQGSWKDDFHYRWNIQLFASRGYVIVAPNPRGSVGYGQKFTDEISKDWGGKVYIDLINSYDYTLKNFKFIDKDNTFAAGASYGGYMINWIEGHTDRFNALVCHDGVFNLESMYGSTEELWFPEWEFGGPPWKSRKIYKKWSPHMFVKNFKTPMLVIHGAHDYRVAETQAMELFTSLQRMNVESKFLYFPDETHFVTKPQNSKLWWNTIFNWFEDHKKEK